jgi:hypothetical protein
MGAGSGQALDELDGVAVGVGYPGGAIAAAEEVVRRGDRRGAGGGEGDERGVDVGCPEGDLAGGAGARVEAVGGVGRLRGRQAEGETVECELDVRGRPGLGRAEGLGEAEKAGNPPSSPTLW